MFPTKALLAAGVAPLKRAQQGLFQGRSKQYGNNVPFSMHKTRRSWLPNIQHKHVYSEVLDSVIRLKITTRAFKTIRKYGGIDNYVLHTKPDILGWQGMRIRLLVQQRLAERELEQKSSEEKSEEAVDSQNTEETSSEQAGSNVQAQTEPVPSEVKTEQGQAENKQALDELVEQLEAQLQTEDISSDASDASDAGSPPSKEGGSDVAAAAATEWMSSLTDNEALSLSSTPTPEPTPTAQPLEPEPEEIPADILRNAKTKELRKKLQEAQKFRATKREFDSSIFGEASRRPTLADARKIREEAGKLFGVGKADANLTIRYIESKRIQQERILASSQQNL